MAHDTKVWRCGKYELKFDRPRIMGVLNVTPDSFSDGGEHMDTEAAIAYGLKMLDDGADIIDVAASPHAPVTPVSPDEEARRVLLAIRALAQRGAIVSVDTRHVEVAKAAARGASIVNDVTGFTESQDARLRDDEQLRCGGHARGRAYRARACAHRRAAGYLCRRFCNEKARAAAEWAAARKAAIPSAAPSSPCFL